MRSAIIYSICFSFGILFQVYFFLRSEFKRKDFKELIKDSGGGLFAIVIFWLILIKSLREGLTIDLSWSLLLTVYVFFVGFGAAFTRSFAKRMLPQINQVSLLILNTIFLYYLMTRFGYTHFLVVFFYIITIISLFLLLHKTDLNNYAKGFLCIWYLMLLISSGFINAYHIAITSINDSYSLYFGAFLSGIIIFYIYCFIVYLLSFIPITENDKYEIAQRRVLGQKDFLLLISSFQELDINTPLILPTFFLLLTALLVNFYQKYIPENLFISFAIYLTIYLNGKLIKPVILSNNDSAAQKL